jgi:2-dehydropantoate 2-reductase
LPKDFYQFRLNIFKSLAAMENNYSSMKEDFNAKRSLELHAIYENAITLAKLPGVSMPLTEMLYQLLQFLNEKNLSEK